MSYKRWNVQYVIPFGLIGVGLLLAGFTAAGWFVIGAIMGGGFMLGVKDASSE